MIFHSVFVHIIICLIWVAEWPPLRKELLTRLTLCSLCSLTICYFGYFSFGFLGQDFGSDCPSSWSLLTNYFHSFDYNAMVIRVLIFFLQRQLYLQVSW